MTDHEPEPISAPALPPRLDLPDAQTHVPATSTNGGRRGGWLIYAVAGAIAAVAVVTVVLVVVLGLQSDSTPTASPAVLQADDQQIEPDEPSAAVGEGQAGDEPDSETPPSGPTETVESNEPPPTTPVRPFGDLGLAQIMDDQRCESGDPDRYVVILASLIEPDSYAADTQAALDLFPGAGYLRTDTGGCTSLRQDYFGVPIYAAYYGPYSTLADACAVLIDVQRGSYIKPLHNREQAPSVNPSDC